MHGVERGEETEEGDGGSAVNHRRCYVMSSIGRRQLQFRTLCAHLAPSSSTCSRCSRSRCRSWALSPRGVSQATIDEFQQYGVVKLSGVLSEELIAGARCAIEQNMERPSWRERTYHREGAQFFQDYVVWSEFEGYKALVTESPLAELAQRLMVGSRTSRIFHDHILVKESGNSIVTPWHQDEPYYLVQSCQNVSFWIPLDRIERANTIEFIRGSHLWGKSFRPVRFDGTDLFENDTREVFKRGELDIIGWEVEPGDVIAFSFKILHGAPANTSPNRRRVISLRFVGDDATFVKRAGQTSPAFPNLEFDDGAPFEGADFPVIYKA